MSAIGCDTCLRRRRQPAHAASPDKPASSGGVPVDRGWAWVVLAAACLTFGMPSGSARVTGIVYLEMLDRFGSDRQLTFWVFSVRSLVSLMLGPLASVILQKISHRSAIIVAAALAAASTAATGFAPVMELTFLTYSILYGFAATLMHVASLTCTSAYFDRHRGLAVGLTTAGGGVMAFVLPQVARELFDSFSFEGALLLYGGIFLHLFVCALLVRPVTSYRPVSAVKSIAKKSASENCDDCGKAAVPWTASNAAAAAIAAPLKARPSPVRQTSVPLGASIDVAMADLGIASDLYSHIPQDGGGEQPKKSENDAVDEIDAAARGGDKQFSLALLKNERMWIICLVTVLASNAIIIIFTALPPYGESVGVSRQRTSTLLAIGGAAEVVCRALHGWLSDRKFISPLLQLGICSGLMGLVTLLCPTVGGEVSVGMMAAACGAVGMAIFTLTTVCTRDLLGEDNMTAAVGIQMAAQAVSAVASTTVMGYLTTLTGRWDEVFYYMGSNLVAATLVSTGYCVRLKYLRPAAAAHQAASEALGG